MALSWHGVLASACFKSEHTAAMIAQAEAFRRNRPGNVRDILLDLSRDAAMIFRLDNREKHRNAIDEKYGRELLELFSMEIGNYSEIDIRMVARAFTGWTLRQRLPSYPHGRCPLEFVHGPADHDGGARILVGETGGFNGESVIVR